MLAALVPLIVLVVACEAFAWLMCGARARRDPAEAGATLVSRFAIPLGLILYRLPKGWAVVRRTAGLTEPYGSLIALRSVDPDVPLADRRAPTH